MIYVFEGGSVVYDGRTISEEQKAKAVIVENLPIPDTPKGKVAVLRANKESETVYYEYVDSPRDEEIEELKEHIADLYELVLFGGVE